MGTTATSDRGAITGDSRAPRGLLVGWAAALGLLAWGLMTLGAFVRASESGLGCPDWPACHGRLVSSGHHAIIEEAHRWAASVLIIGLVGLAIVLIAKHRDERRLLVAVASVISLVALQAVLGGMTVLLKNVSWTVVAHYGGAALLVGSITLLCVRLAVRNGAPVRRDSFSVLVSSFAVLCFGLLLMGSTVANTDSTTACGTDFPLCHGSLLPSSGHAVAINMGHRAWALIVLLLAAVVLWRSRIDRQGVRPIQRAATIVMLLVLIQASLGAALIVSGDSTAMEVVHSSIGSLTWVFVSTLLWLTRALPPDGAALGSEHRAVMSTSECQVTGLHSPVT